MDTADTIASDLIEEIGRANALRYLAGEMVAVRGVGEAVRVARLMWAVAAGRR